MDFANAPTNATMASGQGQCNQCISGTMAAILWFIMVLYLGHKRYKVQRREEMERMERMEEDRFVVHAWEVGCFK